MLEKAKAGLRPPSLFRPVTHTKNRNWLPAKTRSRWVLLGITACWNGLNKLSCSTDHIVLVD